MDEQNDIGAIDEQNGIDGAMDQLNDIGAMDEQNDIDMDAFLRNHIERIGRIGGGIGAGVGMAAPLDVNVNMAEVIGIERNRLMNAELAEVMGLDRVEMNGIIQRIEAEAENNYLDETKELRKNMFITQQRTENHTISIKWSRLGFAKTLGFYSDSNTDDVYGLPVFPMECRALSNSDILEHVAMYLPNNQVLNCRLVCKLWSDRMGYFISRRKGLIVTSENCRESIDIVKKRLNGEPIAASKLGIFNVSSSCLLYKEIYRLFGCTLSNVSLEACKLSPADLKKIFIHDAPNIQIFHFREEDQQLSSVNTLKEIKTLNNGILSLPQMKMLHWDERDGQTELQDFIEACPNLESLELKNFPLPSPDTYKNLKWDSLRTMFLSPKNVLKTEHCQALRYLNLKLDRLILFGVNSTDQQAIEELSKFLLTLADSLLTLEIWLDYRSVLPMANPVHFSPLTVILPNVTKLHTEADVLGHINNLRKLPAITDLEIVSHPNHGLIQNWTNLTKRAPLTPQSSNLTSFRCGDIDGQSLVKVMKMFPSITSLNIYASNVNDKLLRSVITNLPSLKELTFSPCYNTSNPLKLTDSGITGIRADRCTRLRKNLNKFDESEVQTWQSQPNIGQLQSLETLDLGHSVCEITDVSVFFGISRLTKLYTLKMPMCQITDASVALIKTKLTNLSIFGVDGCKQVTSES